MKTFINSISMGAAALSVAAVFAAVPNEAVAGYEPYIGDILAVGYSFCPQDWISAEGQLLSIQQFTPLFALIGVTYGGNGTVTFGIPDLRGRAAMGQGDGPGLTPRSQGDMPGAESQFLTADQMPGHTHAVNANNLDGNLPGPGGKLLAAAPPSGLGSEAIYSDKPANRTMSPAMIASSGQGAAFNVQDSYTVMRYCIATQGIFPPRP